MPRRVVPAARGQGGGGTIPEVPERYNASSILDRNLEAGRGDRVAIHYADERITYRGLAERVNRFGNALRSLGVRREERILLVLNDTPAFPTAFLGAIRIGAVPVPVNPILRSEDFRFFFEDSYARVAVVDGDHYEKLRAALRDDRKEVQIILTNGSSGEAFALQELLRDADPSLNPAATHRDDLAFFLYSSGSTGKPKGVVHLHHDIPYTCESYAKHVLRIVPDDVTFSTSKLFHAYGLGNSLTFPFWAGASAVLHPGRPVPPSVLETIGRHRPSLFFSVPTLYNAILNHPDAGKHDLSSIRLCVSAAEALPAGIWRRWKETFGLTILDGIGTTEMLHIFLSNLSEAVRPGSSGRAVPGYDVKIVDDEGRAVGSGEAGHLLVRGDSSAPHYWHNAEKTARTMIGEWIRTGDWYRVDEEGFFWYEGRTDDMMKVGGMWVSPVEVEAALIEHPAVLEAAVVGVQVNGLNRMKAHVVLRDGHAATPERVAELQTWCKDRLQRYEYPHIVEFVADLPKTVTGKIQRFKLREAASEAA